MEHLWSVDASATDRPPSARREFGITSPVFKPFPMLSKADA